MNSTALPTQRGLYYGGGWHLPIGGGKSTSTNPATGESLGGYALASAQDVDRAVQAAETGFREWRQVLPQERARILREAAAILKANADDLALLDCIDCGNPVSLMRRDVLAGIGKLEFFAGLVTELKGQSIPVGPEAINFSVREPIGVLSRIVAFNHPFQFGVSKIAAPLAAGNAVIVKPPDQAPLSGLRLAELIGHLFPAGAIAILTGGRDVGVALSSHSGIGGVALVGSVPTGRAIMRNAAETLKHVTLELGGKNALIAFADADPETVAMALVNSMNYAWCGQSCGSMSRAFIHDTIHDEVIRRIGTHIARFRPGLPSDPNTTMGSLISREHFERVLSYIQLGVREGATIAYGGRACTDGELAKGNFIEPTVFVDVTQQMRIASEEIFGPVQSIMRWSDRNRMIEDVNSLSYGLACSIYTRDLVDAHRTAAAVQAGYIWVNGSSSHILGAPFGGYKQSGLGREECLEELLGCTQEKNIYINIH